MGRSIVYGQRKSSSQFFCLSVPQTVRSTREREKGKRVKCLNQSSA